MSQQWPNSDTGNVDWIEVVLPDPDPNHDPDYPNVKLRLNVSFLKSRWHCRFGDCPGILVHGAMTDVSCCQIGVGIEEGDEMDRMREMVRQLTPADWDRAGTRERWYTKLKREEREEDEYGVRPPMFHTRVVDGGCIFANRRGGQAGKPGCAFHVLAERTGRHHSETKPDICWQIPFQVMEEWDSEHWHRVVTVSGTPAATWGDSEMSDDPNSIGYWCTETPDAYSGEKMVYQYGEVEYRRQMGDKLYEAMAEELHHVRRRFPTPAERANDGRKMLPLLVASRTKLWEEKHMTENLERSKDYLALEG